MITCNTSTGRLVMYCSRIQFLLNPNWTVNLSCNFKGWCLCQGVDFGTWWWMVCSSQKKSNLNNLQLKWFLASKKIKPENLGTRMVAVYFSILDLATCLSASPHFSGFWLAPWAGSSMTSYNGATFYFCTLCICLMPVLKHLH